MVRPRETTKCDNGKRPSGFGRDRADALADQNDREIRLGQVSLVLAGGTESMSTKMVADPWATAHPAVPAWSVLAAVARRGYRPVL